VARNLKGPLFGAFACAGGLALVAALAYRSEGAQRLDATVRGRFIADPGSSAESLAAAVALLGDPLVLLLSLVVACGIAVKRGRPRDAVAALVVVAGANLTTQALKVLFSHPRVRAALGADLAWDGFPSGHTTAIASTAIAFMFVVPARFRLAIGALGVFLVAAVGCAVVILDWHYPSDVLGGILVASGWGFLALAALRLFEGGYRPARQPGRRPAISTK
jgi:membrane-associated phospholipid phosphatase